jgi:hypothetical protein
MMESVSQSVNNKGSQRRVPDLALKAVFPARHVSFLTAVAAFLPRERLGARISTWQDNDVTKTWSDIPACLIAAAPLLNGFAHVC